MLQTLEVLGVADGAGVQPLLVAGPPRLDLLDVGVGLALGSGQVVDLDLQVASASVDVGPGRRQLAQLGCLRRVLRLVPQDVEPAVQLLYVEQLQLCERVGFQGGLLSGRVFRRGTSTGRSRAC